MRTTMCTACLEVACFSDALHGGGLHDDALSGRALSDVLAARTAALSAQTSNT